MLATLPATNRVAIRLAREYARAEILMADYHLSHEMVAGVALCEETNTSGHEEICRPSDLFTGSQYRMHGHNQGGFCYLVL